MDLSKLPKLSDTKSHEPTGENLGAEPLGSEVRPVPAVTYRQPGVGVDIWISLIIGLLLLAMGRSFGSWAIATMRHQHFATGYTWPDDDPRAGQEVEYFDLQGFTALTDMGIFLFGLTLVFEAGAKTLLVLNPGKGSRIFLMIALLLTLGTVLLNIYACLKVFNYGITPLLSGLAVAFGGWVLYDEWVTLKMVTPRAVPVAPLANQPQ